MVFNNLKDFFRKVKNQERKNVNQNPFPENQNINTESINSERYYDTDIGKSLDIITFEWVYEKISDIFRYCIDTYQEVSDWLYDETSPPDDPEDYKIWLNERKEKQNKKHYQNRLDARNKKIKSVYNQDLNKIRRKQKVCDNWHSTTKTDIDKKYTADTNIYMDPAERMYPENNPNWETYPIDHLENHKKLCENLRCKVESTSTSTSVAVSRTEPVPRLKINTNDRYPNFVDLEFSARLERCQQEKVELNDLYTAARDNYYQCERNSLQRPAVSPQNRLNIQIPTNLREAAPSDFIASTPEPFASLSTNIPWLTISPLTRFFEIPLHLVSGNILRNKKGLSNIGIFIVQIFSALLVLYLYWILLSTVFEVMQSCVVVAKNSIQQYNDNRQEQYRYKLEQDRKDEKLKRRSFRFNIWRRTTKGLVNDAVDIRNQLKKPFRSKKNHSIDSKRSFKRIDRGGYIPPFPNLLLLNPQTYIGLTDFQIQKILFTHDPVHLIIRRQEILDEVEEILKEVKNFSQKMESKVNRVKKIQNIKFKTKSGILATYFYLISLIASTSEISTVKIMSDPVTPVPIMVVQTNPKVKFNNNSIQNYNGLKPFLTQIEQTENLRGISIKKNRTKKYKKFNRKVHTLSDLPNAFHKNHSEIEITEESSLQSMKVPNIKIH